MVYEPCDKDGAGLAEEDRQRMKLPSAEESNTRRLYDEVTGRATPDLAVVRRLVSGSADITHMACCRDAQAALHMAI